MFRLHKHRSSKSGDRIEFRFSNFKALQVPKGWDKLFISVVSVENGKTIAKSSKVPVRNGSCQWSDNFSEFMWVSRDNSSKDIDDCLLKLIVTMGSSRSGILGEATVNMTSYMSSNAAIPLSVPLNKCKHGTVLHVTVQCLTPRTKLRDQESRETKSHLMAPNEHSHDVAVKSNGSDCSYVQSVESFSVDDLDSTLSAGEVETRATSFSGSVSNCSYNSADGSIGRGNFSPSTNDGLSPPERQDSTISQKSVSHLEYLANNSSPSDYSSFNSPNLLEFGASSSKMTNSSNNHLEAAEDTSEELRAEAKMWEMNARKLMGDLDMLRTEFSGQSKKLVGLEMDLSAAIVERDSLKKEIDQLKLSLEDPIVRQKALDDSISLGDCIPEIESALKDELKFQKESNANLSVQLKRSQEANVELVSVLQELEETIEKQKIEIDHLSSLPLRFSDLEKSFQLSLEENRSLMLQLEQSEESKKNLLFKVQELEKALDDKMHDIEQVKTPNTKTLSDIEMEYQSKLSAKGKEILSLKAKLSESLTESCNAETLSRNVSDADLMREIELLKEKVKELEMDCNELTDENLDLALKLKEAKKNSKEGDVSEDLLSNKLKDQYLASFESEESNNVFRIFHPNPNKEVTNKTSEIANLEANLSSKEKEIVVMRKRLSELEAKVYHLEKEKFELEEQREVLVKERDVNSKCLYNLQNDFATVSKNIDSYVSTNEMLAKKSLELEQGKHDLELHISEIKQEKEQLLMRISLLETQLTNSTYELESCSSELEKSRSQAARLQEEVIEIQSEMDSSKEKLKQREEYCSLLEARLRKSDQIFADFAGRVELLENNFSLMLQDIASKEKHLTSKLGGFLDENRKHMEQGQSLLNQIIMEKEVEIQNLEQEIENLSMKLSSIIVEKEKIASTALIEVSTLRADKAKLESAFEEVQSKVILSKTEANMMQTEYDQKLKDLTTELADIKMENKMLVDEHEQLLKLVDDYKSRELKFKSTINALEIKLTVTEYERQQFMDESGNLKMKLQQTHQFENEIMNLKNELISTNSEKERLETSLHRTTELCEVLKAEKTSSGVKILTLEKAASELEDCKRTRSSLKERLKQLESELKTRETRCVQDTELSHIKRINRQHQQTIQLLEQEKTEFQKKAQAFEEELKLIKEQKRNQVSKLKRKGFPVHEDLKASKNLVVKNSNQHRSNRKKSSLKNDRESMKDQQDLHYNNKDQSEVEVEHELLDESERAVEVDPMSKIQLLEISLAEGKEANNMYEAQQNRSPCQGQSNQANGPLKSTAEGELVTKEKFERTKSTLEAELRDIQERYYHMSLKYAEAEAAREELVMKLKEARNKKGWLS